MRGHLPESTSQASYQALLGDTAVLCLICDFPQLPSPFYSSTSLPTQYNQYSDTPVKLKIPKAAGRLTEW